jgi:hypothetical protein
MLCELIYYGNQPVLLSISVSMPATDWRAQIVCSDQCLMIGIDQNLAMLQTTHVFRTTHPMPNTSSCIVLLVRAETYLQCLSRSCGLPIITCEWEIKPITDLNRHWGFQEFDVDFYTQRFLPAREIRQAILTWLQYLSEWYQSGRVWFFNLFIFHQYRNLPAVTKL